jgi:hypothetical protein
MVEHWLREAGAGGSNHLTSTSIWALKRRVSEPSLFGVIPEAPRKNHDRSRAGFTPLTPTLLARVREAGRSPSASFPASESWSARSPPHRQRAHRSPGPLSHPAESGARGVPPPAGMGPKSAAGPWEAKIIGAPGACEKLWAAPGDGDPGVRQRRRASGGEPFSFNALGTAQRGFPRLGLRRNIPKKLAGKFLEPARNGCPSRSPADHHSPPPLLRQRCLSHSSGNPALRSPA